MKLFLSLLLFVFVLVPRLVLADDINEVVPSEQVLLQLLAFITTLKGLSALAIAAGVIQLLMKLMKTPLAAVAGKWRLTMVALLSVVSLVVAAMATGLPLEAAVGSAPVLAGVQVFINQIWKQFFQKEA